MFWPFTVWGFLKPIFKPHEYWLSRTRCYNSTYRLRYWNQTNNYNTWGWYLCLLQQYLPFTVLKHYRIWYNSTKSIQEVTTVLTVYGIETWTCLINKGDLLWKVTTVLTVYGIETTKRSDLSVFNAILLQQYLPFTVLKHWRILQHQL